MLLIGRLGVLTMENFSTDIYKNQYHEDWTKFLLSKSDWKLFLTITFEDFHTREMVQKKWRSLVQILNRDLFRNHYTRIVGHSYFGYAYALEHQKRGALHVHALIDSPIRFDLCHGIGKLWRSFFWIEKVEGIRQVAYVTKYVTKGGDVELYIPKVYKKPAFVPMWYEKSELLLRR